jgi:5-methylcytosine-specific restriction endonuclease McrA
VIVKDKVYAIYRITGIEAEGTGQSLGSEEYKKLDAKRNKKPQRICRKFQLQPIASISIGRSIHGWEGRWIMPVQRYNDSFFNEIEIDSPENLDLETAEQSFQTQITASLRDESSNRIRRLAQAPKIPQRVVRITFDYLRNPDVVVEVLLRAMGSCEACSNKAPFVRRSNSTPYLEVHHKKPLAEGGEDTIENAIALCPNCHRKAHYA